MQEHIGAVVDAMNDLSDFYSYNEKIAAIKKLREDYPGNIFYVYHDLIETREKNIEGV